MGGRRSSMDLSAPTILFESQIQHLLFFNLYLNCGVRKTKMNKQRPALAQI